MLFHFLDRSRFVHPIRVADKLVHLLSWKVTMDNLYSVFSKGNASYEFEITLD